MMNIAKTNVNVNPNVPMPPAATSILKQATQMATQGLFNQYVPGIVSGPVQFLYNTFVGNKPESQVNPAAAFMSHFKKRT